MMLALANIDVPQATQVYDMKALLLENVHFGQLGLGRNGRPKMTLENTRDLRSSVDKQPMKSPGLRG